MGLCFLLKNDHRWYTGWTDTLNFINILKMSIEKKKKEFHARAWSPWFFIGRSIYMHTHTKRRADCSRRWWKTGKAGDTFFLMIAFALLFLIHSCYVDSGVQLSLQLYSSRLFGVCFFFLNVQWSSQSEIDPAPLFFFHLILKSMAQQAPLYSLAHYILIESFFSVGGGTGPEE